MVSSITNGINSKNWFAFKPKLKADEELKKLGEQQEYPKQAVQPKGDFNAQLINPTFGSYTVPGIKAPVVEPTTGIHMQKVTSAVDDGQGNMIAYANNGYVGAMGKTDGIANQAGYEEKAGFKPKLNMLYA